MSTAGTRDFRTTLLQAVLIGGVVYLVATLFGKGLRGVGTALNPTSDRNLAYRGVNAVGAAISGRDSFSLGSWIYDLTHADANLASNPKPAVPADEKTWWDNLTAKITGG